MNRHASALTAPCVLFLLLAVTACDDESSKPGADAGDRDGDIGSDGSSTADGAPLCEANNAYVTKCLDETIDGEPVTSEEDLESCSAASEVLNDACFAGLFRSGAFDMLRTCLAGRACVRRGG